MLTSLRARLRRLDTLPALLLILLNIIIALYTFKDYGYSLDEPLFYGYAEALGYAYSPSKWLKPDFDIGLSYGPSPWDHKNRGPAYLLLARGPAQLLQSSGLSKPTAWHLVNFISFQVGLFFLYRLARRWMNPWGAFFATALLSTQPVLWEHAFINPKDPPFMVFFVISLELGFRMVDYIAQFPTGTRPLQVLGHILVPAVVLGITTSIRILGPAAAVLVGLYFILLKGRSRIGWIIPYGIIAIVVMLATWPYLWESPIQNFLSTLTFMADNPTQLRVLFNSQLYRADNLPAYYLPALLILTLTEPVWPLAIAGMIVVVGQIRKGNLEWKSLLPTFLWFFVPFLYVLLTRPPLYDGFRHFMFIIPPIFILCGLAFDKLVLWLRTAWLKTALIAILLFPGIYSYTQLHPYEYTYYNMLVGGTGGVAGKFETDYWLTCYRDAIRKVNRLKGIKPVVYVAREGYIADHYAASGVTVIDGSFTGLKPEYGQYILEGSRANPVLQKYSSMSGIIKIQRQGAVFCVVRPNLP